MMHDVLLLFEHVVCSARTLLVNFLCEAERSPARAIDQGLAPSLCEPEPNQCPTKQAEPQAGAFGPSPACPAQTTGRSKTGLSKLRCHTSVPAAGKGPN